MAEAERRATPGGWGWPLAPLSATLRGVQGQLPPRPAAARAPLDALFRACLPGSPREARLRRFAWGYLLFQAVLMLAVRVSDGAESFLEGAVARGWAILLLIQVFPLALAISREGVPDDSWARSLAELRGYAPADVVQSARSAPLRALRDLLVPAGMALLFWPGLLLLGDSPGRFALRLGIVLLLGLLSAVGALLLLGLGGLLGRHLPVARAPWALVILFWGPWILGGVAEIPALSLPGLFRMALDAVLGLAPP